MTAIEIHIVERLKQLPPTRVSQVMDFVEFLAAREELAATAARLGDAAKTDDLGMSSLPDEEVEARVQYRHRGN